MNFQIKLEEYHMYKMTVNLFLKFVQENISGIWDQDSEILI